MTMTLDEAKAEAHADCNCRGSDTPGLHNNSVCAGREPKAPCCSTRHESIDTLATVAHNAGYQAGFNANVAACAEAVKKAAEGMRERAADLAEQWRYDIPSVWPQDRKNGRDCTAAEIVDSIHALPLEGEKP